MHSSSKGGNASANRTMQGSTARNISIRVSPESTAKGYIFLKINKFWEDKNASKLTAQ